MDVAEGREIPLDSEADPEFEVRMAKTLSPVCSERGKVESTQCLLALGTAVTAANDFPDGQHCSPQKTFSPLGIAA